MGECTKQSGRDPGPGAFWHCRHCRTPNPARPYLTHCLGCGRVASEAAASREAAGPEPEPRHGGPAHSQFRAWVGRLSACFTATWAFFVLLDLLLIRWVGDRWWGVTVLLFVPRWLFLVPLPVLALASGLARCRRHWILQGVVGALIAGPLMGLRVPIQQLWAPAPKGTRVRIMTLNRGMEPLDVDRVIDLIERERIDLICFQEVDHRMNRRLEAHLADRGWHRDRRGYVASRYPIIAEMPPLADDWRSNHRWAVIVSRVRVRTPGGAEFGVVSVHMPTFRFGFYRFLEQDLSGLNQHVAWWDRQAGRMLDALAEMGDIPILVGGDFNVPPDQASMAALGSWFRFAFEDAGWGYGYTRPARFPWFRIDHILASREWVFTRCWVGPDVGSDHLPLIAEAVLPAAPEARE
jgi:endonuclease/exonuclease/phosphatase (EEP) superfamily protein YafD